MRARRLSSSVSVVALAALAACFSSETAFANPTCKGLGATGVSFGVYNPFSATPLDSVGTVTYNCPPPLEPQISISAGSSGTFVARGMVNPADPVQLQYNLYVDAARTVVWGDGSGGTTTVNAPNKGSSISVFGRVFPLQDVAVGTFNDTVIVTFNF